MKEIVIPTTVTDMSVYSWIGLNGFNEDILYTLQNSEEEILLKVLISAEDGPAIGSTVYLTLSSSLNEKTVENPQVEV